MSDGTRLGSLLIGTKAKSNTLVRDVKNQPNKKAPNFDRSWGFSTKTKDLQYD